MLGHVFCTVLLISMFMTLIFAKPLGKVFFFVFLTSKHCWLLPNPTSLLLSHYDLSCVKCWLKNNLVGLQYIINI